MRIEEKELEQFGASKNNLPKEEWIQRKEDEVTLYHFNKKKLQRFLVVWAVFSAIVLLSTVILLHMRTISLDKLSGKESSIGHYVTGNVGYRTKILDSDIEVRDVKNRKWKYFVCVPYGEEGKYILLVVDKDSYDYYNSVPEINPWEQRPTDVENGTTIKIEGIIAEISELPIYEEYWQQMLGIPEELCNDEKGLFSEEKQEELLNQKMSLAVYIKPTNLFAAKAKILGVEVMFLIILLLVVLYKKRFQLYEQIKK